ncbi:MAG: RDD family protein [Legionella sp.]|nr:RDD family protein [Legionella sp.]
MAFRYFAALIYDGLIVLALLFAYTALCMSVNNNQAIAEGTHWYQLSLLFIFVSYYVFSLRNGGQTIGMRAWRLKIISEEKSITLLQATSRLFLGVLAQIFRPFIFSRTEQLINAWTKTTLIKLSN